LSIALRGRTVSIEEPHRLIDHRATISAYILAGGQSRRFGSDKARAIVGGQPMIVRIAQQLRALLSSVKAVAQHAGAYDALGIATIADLHLDRGPIGGLHAALHDAPARWVLLVSCDFVVLKPAWIERLIAESMDTCAVAVAYRHEYWEPLLALYDRSLLSMVESQIQAGKLSLQHLLSDQANTAALPLPHDWPSRPHVNTREELHEIRTLGECDIRASDGESSSLD
jgi:molybdenum cofactor guanylyltransferase